MIGSNGPEEPQGERRERADNPNWFEVPRNRRSYAAASEADQKRWWDWIPDQTQDALAAYFCGASGDGNTEFPEHLASIIVPWMGRSRSENPDEKLISNLERLERIVGSTDTEEAKRKVQEDVYFVWAESWERLFRRHVQTDSNHEHLVLHRMWYALGNSRLRSREHWVNATCRLVRIWESEKAAKGEMHGIDSDESCDTQPHVARNQSTFDQRVGVLCDYILGDYERLLDPDQVDFDRIDESSEDTYDEFLADGESLPRLERERIAEVAWALFHDPDAAPVTLSPGTVVHLPIEQRMAIERTEDRVGDKRTRVYGDERTREEWIRAVAKVVQPDLALRAYWDELSREPESHPIAVSVFDVADAALLVHIAGFYAADLAPMSGSGRAPTDLASVDYQLDRQAVLTVLYFAAKLLKGRSWPGVGVATLAFHGWENPPPTENAMRQRVHRLREAFPWIGGVEKQLCPGTEAPL